MKAHKILDINFDGDELHFDLRVSVPREKMSGEVIVGLLKFKPLLNGWMVANKSNQVWMKVGALIETDEAGEHTVSIQKTAQELL